MQRIDRTKTLEKYLKNFKQFSEETRTIIITVVKALKMLIKENILRMERDLEKQEKSFKRTLNSEGTCNLNW